MILTSTTIEAAARIAAIPYKAAAAAAEAARAAAATDLEVIGLNILFLGLGRAAAPDEIAAAHKAHADGVKALRAAEKALYAADEAAEAAYEAAYKAAAAEGLSPDAEYEATLWAYELAENQGAAPDELSRLAYHHQAARKKAWAA